MKKLLHLSDLHFGSEMNLVLDVLIEEIKTIAPDYIVVSGDLTQRATHKQYQQARHFLQTISHHNILCVPGNHDISLHNIIERVFYPFYKYKKWIASDISMQYVCNSAAIFGINSATPCKWMSGYVSENQLMEAANFFQEQASNKVKIIVMHHNLIRSKRHKIINDAEKIINYFIASKVNLVLSGHIHATHLELIKSTSLNHNMYIVTAGTPISYRTIEPNSFNIIEFYANEFKFICKKFELDKFVLCRENVYAL